MRNLVTVGLVFAAVIASLAGAQQQVLQGQQAACERPKEAWRLGLRELKEDGVIRVTETSYDPWHVVILREDDDTTGLKACRDRALTDDCYEQEYVRAFGGGLARVSKE